MEVSRDRDGIRLRLYVRPGAKKDAILGVHGDALRVNIAGAPVRGEANRALRRFLARLLNTAPSQIEIVSGHNSRHKTVKVMGVDRDRIKGILGLD
ncbi:MAG: YggU family protein [Proteobacteria bacterium]|nr:YggU family protein [Pseudomonadota bacterium]